MALPISPGGRIHFIGIGGSSMSGLARLMLGRGYRVTGSDRDASHTLDELSTLGIDVTVGHHPDNIKGADLVVFTSAIAKDNPELAACYQADIPTLERPVFLGELMKDYQDVLAVCGTHGKTTATSMLAHTLIPTPLHPTVHIGGVLPSIGSNVYEGSQRLFLTEADEFRANFLYLNPTIMVCLNIDADHMEFYRDIEHVESVFREFADKLGKDGLAIVCGDDPRALALGRGAPCRVATYGLAPGEWDYGAKNLIMDETGACSFTALYRGKAVADIALSVAGRHNAQNALATLAAAMELGISAEEAARALSSFGGVKRRFELTGISQGVRLYHDYGHNPAEYRTVVPLAAQLPHRRLFVVLQPHTYSRLKLLFNDYITAFDGADEVLVTDIFAAREKDPGDIHSTMLVEAMQKAGVAVAYTPAFEDCVRYLHNNWNEGDIVLTVGCGNINLLNEML